MQEKKNKSSVETELRFKGVYITNRDQAHQRKDAVDMESRSGRQLWDTVMLHTPEHHAEWVTGPMNTATLEHYSQDRTRLL